MEVKIMRGISGAGKSTWIRNQTYAKIVTISADTYHMKDGRYQFDPSNIGAAHKDCKQKFLEILLRRLDDYETVYVDNTNLTAWEVSFYYQLAELYCPVEVIRIEVEPRIAVERTVHGVPANVIFRMYDTLRSERLPTIWQERIILAK